MKTNRKREVIARIAGPGFVLAVVFALLLSGSSVGRAQSSAASPAAAPAKPAPATQAGQPAAPPSERRPKGAHEGIHVHGHWVIEVRNPDGTVAARREFENSLITPTTYPGASLTGSQALVALLSGNASVSNTVGAGGPLWAIQLSSLDSGDASPCGQQSLLSGVGVTGITGSANGACDVSPTVTPPTGSVVETTTSGNTASSSLPSQLTLAGTVEATQQGTIDTVFTLVALGNFAFPFSSLTLGLPATATTPATPPVVPAGPNQMISVTVTISFQ